VAVVIVGLAALLLVRGLQYLRESSNRVKCTDNIRQIALGCHNCNDALGSMPPYHVGPGVQLDAKSYFATPDNHGSLCYFVYAYLGISADPF
jgi:hypothetical protein